MASKPSAIENGASPSLVHEMRRPETKGGTTMNPGEDTQRLCFAAPFAAGIGHEKEKRP
jgi:hypothetical protein